MDLCAAVVVTVDIQSLLGDTSCTMVLSPRRYYKYSVANHEYLFTLSCNVVFNSSFDIIYVVDNSQFFFNVIV